jgi:hypothetical protein
MLCSLLKVPCTARIIIVIIIILIILNFSTVTKILPREERSFFYNITPE